MLKRVLFIPVFFCLVLQTTNIKAQFTDLLNFNGTNGSTSYGELAISGNTLYGLTCNGGTHGDGCIFSIQANGSGFTDLFDFSGTNGANPHNGKLSISGDTLYGVTAFGGTSGGGVIFSIETNGSGFTDLFDFSNNNGFTAYPQINDFGGTLYGMTYIGGANGLGVIFSIATNGSGYRKLFDFNGANGANGAGALVISGDTIYGMTLGGGANGEGVVFSIETNGTNYKDLLDFNGTNGSGPQSGLILSGDTLYGTTQAGGADGEGVVFSIQTNGSNYKDVLDFNGTNGSNPHGSLTFFCGHKLCGGTMNGGANGDGLIFSIGTNGSGYTDLFDFNGLNGTSPGDGSLIYSSGVLYGLTCYGGTNGDGVIFSDSMKITVVASPDTICAGENTTITASGGSTYTWTPTTGLSCSNCANPVASPTVTTTYSVASECLTDEITIKVNPLNISFSGNNKICSGTSTTLTASGGTGYLWNTGATTSSIFVSPSSTMVYSVTINNGPCSIDTSITVTVSPRPTITLLGNDTICSGNSTTLTASGGITYLWNNGSTTSSIMVSLVSSTTYTVKVSNGGCSTDTTVTVIVNPSPVLVLASANDSICMGDSVALHVSGTASYSWSPATGVSCTNCANPIATPSVSTTYIVTGHSVNGCSASKTVNINVSTAPGLGSIPNQSTCSGSSVVLEANTTAGFNGRYLWEPGGSTNSSIIVSPNSTTTYTVQYTNGCGTTSTTATVFVSSAPVPSFSADVKQGCAPLCVQFINTSTVSAGDITWSWTFGTGTPANEEDPIYCYSDTGTYTPSLTITSGNGCSSTLQIDGMITIYSKPNANFKYTPQPISVLSPTVQFTDESTSAYGIAGWLWTFGDASDATSNLQNPIHTYQDTGEYCAQLIVENNKGCTDTTTECFDVEPIFTLYIPTAFSPNGDGLNNVFEAKGEYVKNFEMYVFDRWGMEIYHSTNISKGWNGTLNGNSTIAQEDSYVYKIIATDYWNTQHSYIGKVTLLK